MRGFAKATLRRKPLHPTLKGRGALVKKRLLAALAASLLFTLNPSTPFASPVHAEEVVSATAFYVANNGSDSNAGTLNAPFQTLEKARDTIRTLKAEEGLPEGGVTVYLREGRYERTSSFELRQQDSGEADKPITYTAYPGSRLRCQAPASWPNRPSFRSQIRPFSAGSSARRRERKCWQPIWGRLASPITASSAVMAITWPMISARCRRWSCMWPGRA